MISKIHIGLVWGVLFLESFWPGSAIGIAITAFSLIMGVYFFVCDYLELGRAIYYVRVFGRNVSFLEWFLFLLIIVVVVGFFFFMPKGQHRPFASLNYIVTMSGYFLGRYYNHFVKAIKSFENGIKFPGRFEEISDWKRFEKMEVVGKNIVFGIDGEEKTFQMDKRDVDDMHSIIANWKEKVDTSNQTTSEK